MRRRVRRLWAARRSCVCERTELLVEVGPQCDRVLRATLRQLADAAMFGPADEPALWVRYAEFDFEVYLRRVS